MTSLPMESGVFLLKDSDRIVIFVEKANKIQSRVLSYFDKSRKARLGLIRIKTRFIEYILESDNVLAAEIELTLIKKHHPTLNRRGHDEKKYRFIHITKNERFPRIIVKKKILDANEYTIIGPFRKLSYIKKAVITIVNHLEVADCSKEIFLGEQNSVVAQCIRRKTLQCLRPCVVPVNIALYQDRIIQLVNFFEKTDGDLVEDMEQKMNDAVQTQDFENAALIRDKLKIVKRFSK
ncbi:MAG: UvrB/UvrC motif-containing protein [Candidatus Heimdallarchaeota archaeon]|nr:UvrB/UvrC motif-containing protein [Candidatus Heimdallarchaeota archaeon]